MEIMLSAGKLDHVVWIKAPFPWGESRLPRPAERPSSFKQVSRANGRVSLPQAASPTPDLPWDY